MMQLRVRFTLRRMMIAVALLALGLALRASLHEVFEKKIWYGRNPLLGTSTPNIGVHFFVEPRLGFLFIPSLAVVVALNQPKRWLVWAAMAGALLAIGSWVFIRRPVGVWPGGILYWPDYIAPWLRGKPLPPASLIAPFYRIFVPSMVGEVVDLASLFGCVSFLATLLWLRQPPSRRTRAVGALAVVAYPFGAWVSRMWSDRHIGFGKAPFRAVGLANYYLPRPTTLELLRGIFLVSVLVYLVTILVRSRSSADSTSSRVAPDCRSMDVPPRE